MCSILGLWKMRIEPGPRTSILEKVYTNTLVIIHGASKPCLMTNGLAPGTLTRYWLWRRANKKHLYWRISLPKKEVQRRVTGKNKGLDTGLRLAQLQNAPSEENFPWELSCTYAEQYKAYGLWLVKAVVSRNPSISTK